MSKLDQPLDLGEGESGIVLLNLLDGFSRIETVDDCIRQDSGTSNDGLSRYFCSPVIRELTEGRR